MYDGIAINGFIDSNNASRIALSARGNADKRNTRHDGNMLEW